MLPRCLFAFFQLLMIQSLLLRFVFLVMFVADRILIFLYNFFCGVAIYEFLMNLSKSNTPDYRLSFTSFKKIWKILFSIRLSFWSAAYRTYFHIYSSPISPYLPLIYIPKRCFTVCNCSEWKAPITAATASKWVTLFHSWRPGFSQFVYPFSIQQGRLYILFHRR